MHSIPDVAWAIVFSHLDCQAAFNLALTCQACAADFRRHSTQLASKCVPKLLPIITDKGCQIPSLVTWQACWTDSNAVRRLCAASTQTDLLNKIWDATLSAVSLSQDAQNIQNIHLTMFLNTDEPMCLPWGSIKAPLFGAPVAALKRLFNVTNICILLVQPAREAQSSPRSYCQTTKTVSKRTFVNIRDRVWQDFTGETLAALYLAEVCH